MDAPRLGPGVHDIKAGLVGGEAETIGAFEVVDDRLGSAPIGVEP
jgi:hypothetical protein